MESVESPQNFWLWAGLNLALIDCQSSLDRLLAPVGTTVSLRIVLIEYGITFGQLWNSFGQTVGTFWKEF